jgi:hypothetical protein
MGTFASGDPLRVQDLPHDPRLLLELLERVEGMGFADATWPAARTIWGAPPALSNFASAIRQNDVRGYRPGAAAAMAHLGR